ncbi:helix-hairpin-helix domain-containing protein [Halorientalis brevis]|uniref:Helix-hairpin-helix domain-containing protein n=1 Tax=Halorientalis brevis TaxID=1126241 RepID=A0ABD6CB47_9EURY|nr:helix-hairpin-helix domain-containing protein [Halorientalis brevis]
MGLLKLIKAVMGLNGTGSSAHSSAGDSGGKDVDVTVEHEPEPATESEGAVKGTTDVEISDETGAAEPSSDPTVETDAEPDVVDDAVTETATDSEPEPEPESEPDAEPEPAAESDDEGDAETDAAADDESEPAVDGADEPVDTISGIGPAYADRLSDAGIETVGDLVAVEATDVAAETDLSEKRVQRWIDTARGDE